MIVDIDNSKHYLFLKEVFDKIQLEQIRSAFTKEIDNAWVMKQKCPWIDVQRCFMSQYGEIPIGCWLYLFNTLAKLNIPYTLSPALTEYLSSFVLDEKEFKSWVNDLFDGATNEKGEPFKPYEYQIAAAYKLLKYRKCYGEISTSAGKTLITYIMFKWLLDHKQINDMLYVVPSKDLASQSLDKYELYESYLKEEKRSKWTSVCLYSGIKEEEKKQLDKCTLLFATYQSLNKRDFHFFERFKVCFTDECHHNKSASIKKILTKCVNLEYSIGVTGTFPKEDSYFNLVLQAYVGPVVYRFTADELINKEKKGTPIVVVNCILDWATDEEKIELYKSRLTVSKDDAQSGFKALKTEQKFVNDSYRRMKFICDQAILAKHNVLILFGDVQGGYGKEIQRYIQDNSQKNCYYCDGSTPSKNRDYYKQCMEDDTTGNTIIVATSGTFGEGIDIKNVWMIFLTNTVKSDNIVRQICGRGIRKYPNKEYTLIMDFVDDLRYSPNRHKKDNYMWKHYLERKRIYKSQNFQTYEKRFTISDVQEDVKKKINTNENTLF